MELDTIELKEILKLLEMIEVERSFGISIQTIKQAEKLRKMLKHLTDK